MCIEARNSGNTDGSWSGNLTVARTRDPERYPLTGQTYEQLLTSSTQQGTSISLTEYKITTAGRFIRKDLAMVDTQGGVVDEGAVAQVGIACIPQTVPAFEWHRVESTVTSNLQSPTVGFIVRAPVGSTFDVTTILNYQMERYPSAKVEPVLGMQGALSDPGDILGVMTNILGLSDPSGSTALGMLNGVLGPALQSISANGGEGPAGLKGILGWIGNKLASNPTAISSLGSAASSMWSHFSTPSAGNALAGMVNGWTHGRPQPSVGWVELIEEDAEALLPLLEDAAPLLLAV
jgi:hypothetical protein